MAQAVNVNFRLDEDVKRSMEQACADMGLTMSAAFTIFAKKVGREKRIPFEVTAEPLEGVNKIAKTIENKGFSRKGKADGKNFVRWKPLHILERCKEKRQGKTAVRHGLGIVFKL